MEHRNQITLHVGKFALGDADLVAPAARDNDPRRAFGILMEADKTRRQPPHRAHEKVMQRRKYQSGRQHGDHQREQKHVT